MLTRRLRRVWVMAFSKEAAGAASSAILFHIESPTAATRAGETQAAWLDQTFLEKAAGGVCLHQPWTCGPWVR
jgi:hypothetical protein